jgi:hypothetical protein
MLRALVLLLLGLFAIPALAGGACSSLAAQGKQSQESFFPPAEAKVVGSGKLRLHEAPSAQCKGLKYYVRPGDYLTLYKFHGSWANVMYVAKDGEDVIAWVPKNRLEIVGQYGRSP